MSKSGVGLLVVLTVIVSTPSRAADNPLWKPETEATAERFLERARKAAGEMRRFEIEFLLSDVDTQFMTETRSRGRIYCEESIGYRAEVRKVEVNGMRPRTTPRGSPNELSTVDKPETWLLVGRSLTVVDEVHRQYTKAKIEAGSWLEPLTATQATRSRVPPWIDSTINWDELHRKFRVAKASSTPTDFFVTLVPRLEIAGPTREDDERLTGHHEIAFDRKTALPTQWRLITRTHDRVLIYTRFDVDPPARELKVSLTGYTRERNVEPPPPDPTAVQAERVREAWMQLGFRFAVWCLSRSAVFP